MSINSYYVTATPRASQLTPWLYGGPKPSRKVIGCFNNKETALQIAKLIVKIYTTDTVDVKVLPSEKMEDIIPQNEQDLEIGFTQKKIVDLILNLTSEFFPDTDSPTIIKNFTPPYKPMLSETDRVVYHVHKQPLEVIRIKTLEKSELRFYIDKRYASFAAKILERTLENVREKEEMPNIVIDSFPIKAFCICNTNQDGGGAFVEYEGTKYAVQDKVNRIDFLRLANLI